MGQLSVTELRGVEVYPIAGSFAVAVEDAPGPDSDVSHCVRDRVDNKVADL